MTSPDPISPPFKAETLVDDVMRSYPMTIRVFIDHHMQCVGCPVGRVHTLADACEEHGLELADFTLELNEMAENPVSE